MGLRIIIGGDFVPTKTNEYLFCQNNRKLIVGEELDNIFKKSNLNIFNLEVPLTDEISPIDKCGPNLITPTKCVKGITSFKPCFLTLANNHIYDHGENGLRSTLKVLDDNGIMHAGADVKLSKSSTHFIKNINGIKIGVYCCCEHEFSFSETNVSGANLFDILSSIEQIEQMKKTCDFIIVLYHGGKEYYRYPSPQLQNICQKMINKGANLIVCQHSHCVGCMEELEHGTIIYGQGNFLFDYSNHECWRTGILVQLDLLDKNNYSIDYIPIMKFGNSVRVASTDIAQNILNDFYKRSRDIKIPQFIKEEYEKFALRNLSGYLFVFGGELTNNILFRIINRITFGYFSRLCTKIFYTKNILLALQNFIECEAHRELLLSGIKGKIKNE